jgi:hypothetical protein
MRRSGTFDATDFVARQRGDDPYASRKLRLLAPRAQHIGAAFHALRVATAGAVSDRSETRVPT